MPPAPLVARTVKSWLSASNSSNCEPRIVVVADAAARPPPAGRSALSTSPAPDGTTMTLPVNVLAATKRSPPLLSIVALCGLPVSLPWNLTSDSTADPRLRNTAPPRSAVLSCIWARPVLSK